MGLSLFGFALAQTGESMSSPYNITNALFGGPSQQGSGLRWWSWSTLDSTRQRTNDHNLNTGPDVVWKLTLPRCLDSLGVHFAYHDDGGDGQYPGAHRLYIINATTGDTIALLENSYDDHMGNWVIFRGGSWVGLGYGAGFNGPGTAYVTGYQTSTLFKSGTGGGWGAPLADTLRLAAGDEVYFIYTHDNGGPGSVDSLYLEIWAVERVRSLPALDLSTQAQPEGVCYPLPMGYWYTASDTANDNRNPVTYLFREEWYKNGSLWSNMTQTSSSGTFSGSLPWLTPTSTDYAQGYIALQLKVVAQGLYAHPAYPSLSTTCVDTSAASDTVTYEYYYNLEPSPLVQYGGVDYSHGQTISVPPGSALFQARDANNLCSNNPFNLAYEWQLDGMPVGTSSGISVNLTPGSHTLTLKVTNPLPVMTSSPVWCSRTIQVTLDATTALGAAGSKPALQAREGGIEVFVPQGGTYAVRVYDVQGRKLAESRIEGGRVERLLVGARGILLVQVQGEGQSWTERVWLE